MISQISSLFSRFWRVFRGSTTPPTSRANEPDGRRGSPGDWKFGATVPNKRFLADITSYGTFEFFFGQCRLPHHFWQKGDHCQRPLANWDGSAISDENVQKSGSMKTDEQNYREEYGFFWVQARRIDREGNRSTKQHMG